MAMHAPGQEQRIFSPDPVSPLLMEDPQRALNYLVDMRRHYLAMAANCERMISDIRLNIDSGKQILR
jgi:hypothetical protein